MGVVLIMIFIIGFMLLIVSSQILLLCVDSKLEKVLVYLELNNKSKKKIKIDKEIEKIRKDFL